MNIKGDGRLTQSAAIFSMCVAGCLILMKGFAWLDSDSSSVLASFADSSLDIIVSLINFFAIRLAFAPADKSHPFGHGKAESLAALMQSAFISGSAFVLLLHAGERLVNPKELVAWEGHAGHQATRGSKADCSRRESAAQFERRHGSN